MEWVLCKNVFDVSDEQLLVLLLVMKTDREDRFDLFHQFVVGTFQKLLNMGIDGSPKPVGFRNGGTRDQPAQIAPVHAAGGVVVRIEKISVLRHLWLVGGH